MSPGTVILAPDCSGEGHFLDSFCHSAHLNISSVKWHLRGSILIDFIISYFMCPGQLLRPVVILNSFSLFSPQLSSSINQALSLQSFVVSLGSGVFRLKPKLNADILVIKERLEESHKRNGADTEKPEGIQQWPLSLPTSESSPFCVFNQYSLRIKHLLCATHSAGNMKINDQQLCPPGFH